MINKQIIPFFVFIVFLLLLYWTKDEIKKFHLIAEDEICNHIITGAIILKDISLQIMFFNY